MNLGNQGTSLRNIPKKTLYKKILQVYVDQTKKSNRTVFFWIVWSQKKKGGVSPEHDVTPMASDHLPLRVARLFLPCQLAK